ncbi:MAG: hypothetical protein ABIA78_02810 [archaeon]
MKRGIIIILFVSILLISPLVQAQTYSGFNRFTDDVKLFFSFGDKKVNTALEIREKEVDSAIENFQNENTEEVDKNLKNAWEKLQLVQERVTLNTAGEVTESANRIRNRIIEQGDLTEDFEVYVLEEEKTELTAEWVIEVNGKEGQTLNGKEGQTLDGKVEVVYEIDGERVVKIENRIKEIDNEIAKWVVETSDGKDERNSGLKLEVKTETAEGKDDGLKREVKTNVAGDGTLKNDPLPVPDLNKVNPDLYDPDARAPGDSLDGDCGDDVVCGGANDVIENVEGDNVIDGGTGTEGVNEEPSPAVEVDGATGTPGIVDED